MAVVYHCMDNSRVHHGNAMRYDSFDMRGRGLEEKVEAAISEFISRLVKPWKGEGKALAGGEKRPPRRGCAALKQRSRVPPAAPTIAPAVLTMAKENER